MGCMADSSEKELKGDEKKYYKDMDGKCRAESDVRTLLDAKSIHADKDRHAAAMFCIKQKRAEMDKITSEDNGE